ncbi:Violaxanthin de-epoxidase-domain-containing protein [Pavlovales sp. CCMP2436]|nr:Violaxanthin de-epoxidase-domain-containing protein [Pavlovales sp. CCMP2436]|mmetsp:Transcript_17779/g.42142  ORF Transcript_17779/g.42142 Transcript_17779/m.42142 type:complete len:411 (+) Transcript_17779:64-1296(+)
MGMWQLCALAALAVGTSAAAAPPRSSLLSALRSPARAMAPAPPAASTAAVAWRQPLAQAFAAFALVASLNGPPAGAMDSVAVGECLLQNCAPELARCIIDPACAANIVCLNLCNGQKDETGCEIRCGDQFGNAVVEKFNTCAVTNKKCVPQEKDKGLYPVPPADATVDTFDTRDFTGVWYITAGLNELFDTFPCQRHVFTSPEKGKLEGDLYWRIKTPYGAEVERTAEQNFVADPDHAGILYNHGNEFLHYQDDWYIIGYKPDEYALVYYRGSNDAWDGYGGAVLYTRAKALPAKYEPELKVAAAKAGLKWEDFKKTDNSCRRLQQIPFKEELERDAGILRLDLKGLENDVEVGLFGLPTEIGKDLRAIERVIETDEKIIVEDFSAFENFLANKLGFGRAAKTVEAVGAK